MSNTVGEALAEEIASALQTQRDEMAEKEQERLDKLKEKDEKMGKVIVDEVLYTFIFANLYFDSKII